LYKDNFKLELCSAVDLHHLELLIHERELLIHERLKCSLPFITATADGPKHIEATLSRAKFEELCSDLIDR
jgi:hypothetical protein